MLLMSNPTKSQGIVDKKPVEVIPHEGYQCLLKGLAWASQIMRSTSKDVQEHGLSHFNLETLIFEKRNWAVIQSQVQRGSEELLKVVGDYEGVIFKRTSKIMEEEVRHGLPKARPPTVPSSTSTASKSSSEEVLSVDGEEPPKKAVKIE